MSKTALARIPSLTFYKDAPTLSRRGQPIPQLVCVGKPCDLYQPEAVRCTNVGGSGTDVDWKCEADLPEALRFGRVEVSCEGWSGPGDPYVLKGSCSLEYRLVRVSNQLRQGDNPLFPPRISGWLNAAYNNPSAAIFAVIWTACLVFILYRFLKSCWAGRRASGSTGSSRSRPSDGGGGGGGWGSGWFSGTNRPDNGNRDPPPPYTKYPTSSSSSSFFGAAQGTRWRPGFWTGAALGGMGTYLLNRNRRERAPAYPAAYEWEHDRLFRPAAIPVSSASRFSDWGSGRRVGWNSDDRGEGSSSLGSMRRSTGLGGSNVR